MIEVFREHLWGDVDDFESYVPSGEEGVERCSYCGRPFRDEHIYWLHIGEIHSDECNDEEMERYNEEFSDETDALFNFHMKVIVGVFLVYFIFTMIYAHIWSA